MKLYNSGLLAAPHPTENKDAEIAHQIIPQTRHCKNIVYSIKIQYLTKYNHIC